MVIAAKAPAQITSASLQASGLTCSMCSKAVKNALEKVPFVEKVLVDIKTQQYNLALKKGASVDLDAVSKAVEDAGFSVSSLKVTAAVENLALKKDEHFAIGGQRFHFLKGASQTLNGAVTFSVVDKGFVPKKEAAKYAALTSKPCAKTGRTAACCKAEGVASEGRIYHVII